MQELAPRPHICWLISFSWISHRRFMKFLCQKGLKETHLTWDKREPTHGCRGRSQEQLLSFPCGNCSSGELSRNLHRSPTSSSSTSHIINLMMTLNYPNTTSKLSVRINVSEKDPPKTCRGRHSQGCSPQGQPQGLLLFELRAALAAPRGLARLHPESENTG